LGSEEENNYLASRLRVAFVREFRHALIERRVARLTRELGQASAKMA